MLKEFELANPPNQIAAVHPDEFVTPIATTQIHAKFIAYLRSRSGSPVTALESVTGHD